MATYLNVNRIIAGSEDDYITGTDGDDDLRGSQGNDFIIGGKGADFIRGGAGDDRLWGGNGNDRLEGAGGNDDLRGGRGNDVLFGGNGRDILSGDIGFDVLNGGAGDDLFYFSASTAAKGFDRINDFAVGDQIRFDRYKANDDLIFEEDGANINIYVDLKGDGTVDYLAVVVVNAALADVEAATSFGGLTF